MYTVDALLTGKAKPFRGDEKSAFAKEPVSGPVHLTTLGLDGDEQADPKHHGGPHMAVHLYPLDHHAFWRDENGGQIGNHDILTLHGAFGTNLSVPGITEDIVHPGDRFYLGSALLEVSQPRMPCWKIEHRFGEKGMVAKIIQTGKCGWYFRVLEEGVVQGGDGLIPDIVQAEPWTIGHVFSAIVNPKFETNAEELLAIAECPTLAPLWQDGARQKAAQMS